MSETRSTCCYCGVGCGVVIAADDGVITGVRGDPEHPANSGRLCAKGSTLHLSARHDLRALHPELRRERVAPRRRASWDEALDHCAQRFADIIAAHGPDSVAFYVSGQLLTEDYYVFNKLARGLVGTNNIDTNSRLCMSSAVAGYKRSLGADAPPACYEDIDCAACLFIAGSNTVFAHPVIYRRIEDARSRNPALKVIVVDPRRTATAAEADLHLAIFPGTDIALYNAMLHVMLREGWVDEDYIRKHTTGFAGLQQTLREYPPDAAAQICGVAAADIVTAARWFAQSRATLSLYCQGLNQSAHGTHNNCALINLHLATGHIGRPGAGPFSLTGQPNAMGGREVGAMATLLAAHRDPANAAHRAEVARLWGVEDLPARPGKTAVELFHALAEGSVRAIWIACTNPAHSMPDQQRVRAALEKAEFVVVQDAYRNIDTAAYADVLLPAASWGEKEGTVTNSERRISRVRAAVAAPGEARADWEITVDFARRLALRLKRPQAMALFPYLGVEEIFNEHRASTRGRDLDITGLSYALLERAGPQQWPYPEGAASGRARLYGNGIFPTADGRARFVEARHSGAAENVDARYPLHLTTGRLRDQWHGMSRSGTVARLCVESGEPTLAMHADDLVRYGLGDGALARVASRRGELVVRVAASDEMRPAQAFMAMHWGSQFMAGAGVNALMLDARDPFSGQPELKHAAVRVEPVTLPWEMVILARLERGLGALVELQPRLARFAYAALTLFGRDTDCVALRVAASAPPAAETIAALDALLGIDAEDCAMEYRDARRNIIKRVLIRDGRLAGVRLSGETAARDWLKEVMANGAATAAVRRWMLAPLAAPPERCATRSHTVCACLGVGEDQILVQVAAGASLEAVQRALQCGTACGSCLPELRRLCAGSAQSVGAAA
ncbi:MAG: molybdopterin-dependent oxidoreductase [Burkholderiales bacterium]